MRSRLLFLPLVLIFFGSFLTFADTQTANESSADTSYPGHRGKGVGKNRDSIQKNKQDSGSDKISGLCTVVQSASNPISGPCVGQFLALIDEKGNEVIKNRTSTQGRFEFIAEKGKSYTISPTSRFYDLVSPKTVIHAGDRFELKLQQK